MAELWPVDDTARILQRILIGQNFGAGVRNSEADKCRLSLEFCDTVLRENSCRAVERDPPLSYRQARERWSDITEQYQASGRTFGGASANSNSTGNFGKKTPAGTTMGSTAPGRPSQTGKVARYFFSGNSYPVCFNFNRGACGRPIKPPGCDDGRGSAFAHVCNFLDRQTNRFCYAFHPKQGNH